MTESVLNFSESASLKLLASDKWQDVLQGSKIILNRVLSAYENSNQKPDVLHGLSWKEAVSLYRRYKDQSYAQDRASVLQEQLSTLDKNQIGAIAHLEAMAGMLNAGAHIQAQRNQQNGRHGDAVFNRQLRRETVKENIKTLARVYKPQEIAQLYKNLSVLMIITPHPTTDKKEPQEKIFADLIAISEQENVKDRDTALERWITKNLEAELIAHEKQSAKEETNAALDQQQLYTDGMIDFLEDVQDAADEVLGGGVIDFTDPEFGTDLAERSWHNTDLDGKRVPASVVLAQRIEGASRATKLYLEILQDLSIPQADADQLSDVRAVFDEMVQKLSPLEEALDDIRLLDSGSAKYRLAKKTFNQVFTSTPYKNKLYKVGPELSAQIISDMREIVKAEKVSAETSAAIRRVIMAYNQNGMALGRQQFRHDSGDYFNTDPRKASILGNLFSYLEERHSEVLQELIPSGKSFDQLRPKNQAYFFKKLFLLRI